MRVLILGIDGYIGHSLALHLLSKGFFVAGADNGSRRKRVAELGSYSLTPIADASERESYIKSISNKFHSNRYLYLGSDDHNQIRYILEDFKPDAIVHLAEMPSAPWSMQGPQYATITQKENVIGTLDLLWAIRQTCPTTHLIKLGTMGEYGTPNCDIPEGTIPKKCLDGIEPCPMSGLLFPRTAGSFYHLSKVMDTLNIHFACRTWGLTSTDIMQGVVFGLNDFKSEVEMTRFDYYECFGTVLNRFCVQAIIGHPLTIYGGGGQTRGYLPLKDSLQCITIALNNPPKQGEYRTLNQFESVHTIYALARIVTCAAKDLGIKVNLGPLMNPRVEAEDHYYNPSHQTLFDLGYVPTRNIQSEVTKLIEQLLPYKHRIIERVIEPKIHWR